MTQLVADADARGRLMDELHELGAFLRARASEMAGGPASRDLSSALAAAAAPAALQSVSADTVTAWLQVAQRCPGMLACGSAPCMSHWAFGSCP